MNEDAVRDLAIVLATAIPLIVVAYYTAMPAIDEVRKESGDLAAIRLPDRGVPTLLGSRPVAWSLRNFGSSFVTEAEGTTPARLWILADFRIGTSIGFTLRSTLAFLLAVSPIVLVDEHSTAARWCAAIALVLTAWNLQSLIFYSSLVSALDWQHQFPGPDGTSDEPFNPPQAADGTVVWPPEPFPRDKFQLILEARPRLPYRLVCWTSISSLVVVAGTAWLSLEVVTTPVTGVGT